MQAVYFPENYYQFDKNDIIRVTCNHDEYSLWFDVNEQNELQKISQERSLGCTLMSRNRLAQCNDAERNNMFIRLFKKVL
jgi:protein arginine N-methyltransferase 7